MSNLLHPKKKGNPKGKGFKIYYPLKCEYQYKRPKVKSDHDIATPNLALARVDIENEESILEFVNNWGLLGLWNTSKYKHAMEEAQGRDPYHSYEHPEKMHRYRFQEPLDIFKTAVKEYQEYIKLIKEFGEIKKENMILSKEKRNLIVDVMDSLLDETKKMVTTKYNDISDSDIEKLEEEETKALFVTLNMDNILQDASPHIQWDLKELRWKTGWKFNSLLSAIYLKTFLDLQEGKVFKYCLWKNCRKPYASNRNDSQFCSDKCRNNNNVHVYNLREWKKNLLETFQEIDREWLEMQIDSLIEQGVTGEKRLEKKIKSLIKGGK